MSNADYNNYSAGGAACSYSNLSNYTANYSMTVPAQGKVITGQYIVPTWSPIAYDSLTSKVPSCSGYSDITNAYGKDAGSCQTTYRTSLCGAPSGAPAATGTR
jgi:hypothetical protein